MKWDMDFDGPFLIVLNVEWSNQTGEGTMVETSREWASSSGYGIYLDGLHAIH
jgi:hypothetical protein